MPHPKSPAEAPASRVPSTPNSVPATPPAIETGGVPALPVSPQKERLRTVKLLPRQTAVGSWEPGLEITTDGRGVLPFDALFLEWRELQKRAGAKRARKLWDFVQVRFVHYFADEAAFEALRTLRTWDEFRDLSEGLAQDCMDGIRNDPEADAWLTAYDAYGVAWLFVAHRAPDFILNHFGVDFAHIREH